MAMRLRIGYLALDQMHFIMYFLTAAASAARCRVGLVLARDDCKCELQVWWQ